VRAHFTNTLFYTLYIVAAHRTWSVCTHGERGSVRSTVPPASLRRSKRVANREIRVWHFVVENGY
jgi:hypothetical protein